MSASAPVSVSVVHRYFEVSLFLLVTVGFLALASTGELDLFSLLLVGGALVVKALRYRRHREPELSPQTVAALTWFYFVFYLVDLFVVSGQFLVATTHLVLFIAVVKLFSARTNRDYLWLALVAFMEILAAATLTVGTTFLVFFFFFLLVGISTFISYEIKRGGEAASTAPLAAGSATARRLERSLLVTSVAIGLATLALATLFFFLLPRFTTGYLSAYAFQPENISGFTDEVTLGDIGSIKRNPAVVMRLRVQDGQPWQLEGLKWRGLALTYFDGHRWSTRSRYPEVLLRSSDGRFRVPRRFLRDLPPVAPIPARRIRYRVLLEPISARTLFAAAAPVSLDGRFRLLGVYETGSVYFFRRGYSQVGYDVVSEVLQPPPDLLRSLPADYPSGITEPYLQLPAVDPRVVDLARQVTADFDNPYDKARALERYLRTRFGYTLELPRVPEEDPIAHFLFERRKGHCEYFAASMTVMLRTQGIPARLVNGFLTGEYNEVGENYIVRARDAHTWVEVYFPGVGWIEFDPTPPDPNARLRTWWTTVQHYFDAFDLWWDEWVINYDERHQFRLAQNLRRALSWSRETRHWWRQKRRALTAEINQTGERLLKSPYAAPVGVGLALLLLLGLRGRAMADWMRALWLLRRGEGRALNATEATLLYRRLLKLLERKGYRKAPAQTPLEFAGSLPPPELASTVGEFSRLYNLVRFGAQAKASPRLLELLRRIQTWKPER